jgi:MYXO-CTERM domain-containing protein
MTKLLIVYFNAAPRDRGLQLLVYEAFSYSSTVDSGRDHSLLLLLLLLMLVLLRRSWRDDELVRPQLGHVCFWHALWRPPPEIKIKK